MSQFRRGNKEAKKPEKVRAPVEPVAPAKPPLTLNPAAPPWLKP